jgi:succinate dehydrogenase/fumarate reductase flavoprotein subunit
MEEGAKFLRGDEPPDVELAGRRMAEDVRVLGAAMVAALFKGLLDRGVRVRTDAPVDDLVVVDGDVIGVALDGEHVGARRGVVLACGGFEWNAAMVKAFIGEVIEPLSPPSNEGDGHRMAMEAGAELANMGSFWGQPSIVEPGFEYEGRNLPQMGSIRGTPGVIVVNRHGQRFVNEGVTYQDFPKVLQVFDPVAIEYPNEAPNWVIFDQRVKDTAVVLPSVLPGEPAPDWITQAPTIRELAESIGVEPANLEATVARWNEQVDVGEDADYGRGTMIFEVHMSGRDPSPAICMAPIERPPFYAIPLVNGALGTNGGPRIDCDGRVRRLRGGVVPGLYAAGNAAASVFGPAYPGGGATIGPAMTFGYRAGRHVASQPDHEL